MIDMLPFPNVTSQKVEGQVSELYNYLIQFKETLEFILGNIGIENLSAELVGKLNQLGADIEKSKETIDEQAQQFSSKTLTVSDVINSDAFKEALESAYEFSVNFDTGNLEYTRK